MAVARKIHEFMERGSWIRKMFEEGIALKQQFGEDNVFDLSLGNPIMEPPAEFFEELRRIAEDGAFHDLLKQRGIFHRLYSIATSTSTRETR